jgi:hypothetical protein
MNPMTEDERIQAYYDEQDAPSRFAAGCGWALLITAFYVGLLSLLFVWWTR